MDYLLYGENFTVFTDNNPLTCVLTTAQLEATGHRCTLHRHSQLDNTIQLIYHNIHLLI